MRFQQISAVQTSTHTMKRIKSTDMSKSHLLLIVSLYFEACTACTSHNFRSFAAWPCFFHLPMASQPGRPHHSEGTRCWQRLPERTGSALRGRERWPSWRCWGHHVRAVSSDASAAPWRRGRRRLKKKVLQPKFVSEGCFFFFGQIG